jgi:hypothetical protein
MCLTTSSTPFCPCCSRKDIIIPMILSTPWWTEAARNDVMWRRDPSLKSIIVIGHLSQAWCIRIVTRRTASETSTYTVSQAYFAVCTSQKYAKSSKFSGKKNDFGSEVTSEASLRISQNLKVTRLQGGPQTKHWTCWQNFDRSRSFGHFLGLVHGFAVLQ